jgi:uncharacterized small protein (DUF1192 family)
MARFDEDGRQIKTGAEIGQDLSLLSEDDLAARIEALKLEIERVEAEQKKRKSVRSAADAFFKSVN